MRCHHSKEFFLAGISCFGHCSMRKQSSAAGACCLFVLTNHIERFRSIFGTYDIYQVTVFWRLAIFGTSSWPLLMNLRSRLLFHAFNKSTKNEVSGRIIRRIIRCIIRCIIRWILLWILLLPPPKMKLPSDSRHNSNLRQSLQESVIWRYPGSVIKAAIAALFMVGNHQRQRNLASSNSRKQETS